MPVEEAYAEIDGFAATLDGDRNGPLTLLFTGLLQTINAARSEIIAGIERYAPANRAGGQDQDDVGGTERAAREGRFE